MPGRKNSLLIVGVVLLLAAAAWRGFLGVILLLAGAFALLVIVSVVASLSAIVIALLPVPKVPITYNLRNLQVRWKTTLLTAVAFTVVILLVTVMLAFLAGMKHLTDSSGQPGNIMVLSDGATDEAFSSLPPAISVQNLPKELQDMVARDRDGKYWAVKEVYVFANQELPAAKPGELQSRFVQVRGVDDPLMAAKVHGIELEEGEWFSPSGGRTLDNGEFIYEAVLGNGMAKIFGKDKGGGPLKPGDVVTIGPKKWYVVGIMKASGSVFGSETWAKDDYVARNFGRLKDGALAYNSIVVRVKNPAVARAAAARLKKERTQEALEAVTENDYYSKLGETNQQFLVMIAVITIFMAFGGILGVMITMFAAINLRAKDVGMLRLLGFTRWQLLWSFLLESIVIAFLGGIAGCALATLANGLTTTSIMSSGAGGGGKIVMLKLVVSGSIMLVSLVLTFIMGAVGGLIPSLFSMRLRPLESLR